nr:MAG: hypothetical protein [Microviridae sp.]
MNKRKIVFSVQQLAALRMNLELFVLVCAILEQYPKVTTNEAIKIARYSIDQLPINYVLEEDLTVNNIEIDVETGELKQKLKGKKATALS